MKPKSNIVKHLERLINQTTKLRKEKHLPFSTKYDLWKRRVELFLLEVCGDKITEEFKNLFKDEESFTLSSNTELKKSACIVALLKARNLLKAVKENIELFGSDKEAKKEAETIKRKFKRFGIGTSGVKYERGEETETKS